MRIINGSDHANCELNAHPMGDHCRLRALEVFGQSVWLDEIRRSLLTSGELRRLITEDGLRGVTSNPAIFEKAVTGSSDYREILEAPDAQALNAQTLYERIAVRDIQEACDALRSVYVERDRRDGYVSLEVSPFLAHDTAGTLTEARRLWSTVGRENLMIKVPATAEGLPAIERLISEGINVNVTLLFALEPYAQAAEAYIVGLERLVALGGDPGRVASVASFFISRIDTAVDSVIASRVPSSTNAGEQGVLGRLTGRVAIANAKLAYQRYQEIFGGARWQALAAKGARTQRLLWASTGVKDPGYRDVLYVEELIGRDTVNTIPPATLKAFQDHGRPRESLTEGVEAAHDTMDLLAQVGISMNDVADRLLAQGVQLFADAFAKLLKAIEKQSEQAYTEKVNRLTCKLPEPLAAAVSECLSEWHARGKVGKLWGRDASLWTGKDEARWLGWLDITNNELAHVERLTHLADMARNAGLSDVLLLGMGGSSLGPEVVKMIFGKITGFPDLHVLDSTDPAQVKRIEQSLDLKKTLFIVSSKSGSTLEPDMLRQYFFDRLTLLVGSREAGRRFVAITDPGSKLQQLAGSAGFRHIFLGRPDIGGRYSVLSNFGLVPAAIMGVDVARLLERTQVMVTACMPSVPAGENPGLALGAALGVGARDFGRDKVTLIASPGLHGLGGWLEQLLAESTGKDATGLIPINGEELGTPGVYGHDRLFVYLRLQSAPDALQDGAVSELERFGHPVLRIEVGDQYDLGQEFFRWEFGTAVAGSLLEVHPFDQPDVEASKDETRRLTAEYERTGALPAEQPIFSAEGIQLFTDDANATSLSGLLKGDPTLADYLAAHLSRLGAGDYFALLAYIEMNPTHDRELQAIRAAVRDARRVATCVEYGPRFLHSTGQAYKGGPNTGVFLQITCDDAVDVPVPGRKYTFGVVKAAQARGDYQVLVERNRRALRVHLGSDVFAGLRILRRDIEAALQHRTH